MTSANMAKLGFGFAAFCNTVISGPDRQQLGVVGELGGMECRCIGHSVVWSCTEGKDNNEDNETLQTISTSKRVIATFALTSIGV